jgi:hypothetical protein
MSRVGVAFGSNMRTIDEIHADIERANEERHELWHTLSEGFDPEVAADIKALDERLEALWQEHRQTRAALRWGDRDRIVARARAEERLERTAA